jgi:hypothetical protein
VSIALPDDLLYINAGAFSGLDYLKRIDFPADPAGFFSPSSLLYAALSSLPASVEIYVPATYYEIYIDAGFFTNVTFVPVP